MLANKKRFSDETYYVDVYKNIIDPTTRLNYYRNQQANRLFQT